MDEGEDHSTVATRRTALNLSLNRALKGPATVTRPLRGPAPRGRAARDARAISIADCRLPIENYSAHKSAIRIPQSAIEMTRATQT